MLQPAEKVYDLVATLNDHRDRYYNQAAPIISDAEYDRLFDELVELEDQTGIILSNSPTQTVGYPVVQQIEKVRHEVPLLSLDKTKQAWELASFIGNHESRISLKLDGLTVKLVYEDGELIQASTRGDGNEGQDITHNVYAISGIPMKIRYQNRLVVTGEAFIKKSDFECLKKTLTDSNGNPYRNGRNLAAGSIQLLDASTCAGRRLNFMAFNVLNGFEESTSAKNSKQARLMAAGELGFQICPGYLLTEYPVSVPDLEKRIQELKQKADELDLPIDGIVLTFDDVAYSKSCGKTGHHYKDGLAFKFEDEKFETVLRGVEWSPSRFGDITPVAVFDPVEIDGCTVERATLHNLRFLKELQLGLNDRILVSKRNMIIPQVEGNLDRSNTLKIPETCPCCGNPTKVVKGDREDVEFLFCDNPNCTAKHIRKFVHFVSKKAMNIQGLSEAILTRFHQQGWLSTYSDLYHLDRHRNDIIKMEGFGEKSFDRLWKAIEESRKVDFSHFLCSMDIPLVGSTASGILSEQFHGDIDAFLKAADEHFDFSQIPGIGTTLQTNIYQWLDKQENRKILSKMKEEVIFMTNTPKTNAESNPFTGKTIVVTGTLENFTRNEINDKIIELGARAGSSVSKKTDYVLVGEKPGSKLDKAKALGIPVLSENEFLTMISA